MSDTSYLYNSIIKIYEIFVQNLADDDENPDEAHLAAEKMLKRKFYLDDLPLFLNSFAVSEDDKEYIDNILDKLMILTADDDLVRDGIDFKELLDLLRSVHFFQQMGLTDKE